MSLNKNYKRPFYKSLLSSRKNVLNNSKVFYFKKKKWEKFKFFAKKQLRFFKRYRFRDQKKLLVNKFAHRGNSFKKDFKFYLTKLKIIQLKYGNIKKKTLKRTLLNNSGEKVDTIVRFENKLATVIHSAKLCVSIKQARQIILHGHVRVNNRTIKDYNYTTLHGDKIEINPNSKSTLLIRQNLRKATFWPIPPVFLQVNYATLTIITLWNNPATQALFLPFNLNLNLIQNKIKYR